MSKPKISWEIVLAGLTFAAIGIYFLNHHSSDNQNVDVRTHRGEHRKHRVTAPEAPSLPGAIVIDLKNLDNIQNLKDLKRLKNIDQLKDIEIKLKNLDKVIKEHAQKAQVQESVNQSLKQLETELQKAGGSDFKVKLQNQKIYINKDYDVDSGKWSEVSAGVYVFKESFSVSNIHSVDLDLGFGNVNIVGGDTQDGEITLQATGNVDDPATLSKKLTIQKELTSPAASFKVHSAGNANLSDQINLEATLTIPQDIRVKVHTSGGHISADNLSNDQVLKTDGGHIALDDIQGKTVAQTEGGHISGDHLSGNILLSTGGGHIRVDRFQGSLTAKTAGGHIEIKDGRGHVSAKTSGGNISASMSQVDGPLKFSTSAGNITLFLPQNIAADVDASGSTVDLSRAFNFSGTRNKGHITGRINDGTTPLVIDCGYGNVNINPKK